MATSNNANSMAAAVRAYRAYPRGLATVAQLQARGATVDAAAQAAGLGTYDTALPQPWVDAVLTHTPHDPRGHCVTAYDQRDGVGGTIRPVTREGAAMLTDMRLRMAPGLGVADASWPCVAPLADLAAILADAWLPPTSWHADT